MKWVGMALFAPELVLYTAYSQYSEARDLVKELNRLRFRDDESTEGSMARKWVVRASQWFKNAGKVFNCCKKTAEREKADKVTSRTYIFAGWGP
jgi:hypothetical protein